MTESIRSRGKKNGVAFVADRVMHYHVPTMKAIESRLAAIGIPFSILSATDAEGAVGRVAVRDKVVASHEHFRLTERKIGPFQYRYQHGLMARLKAAAPAVVMSMCHSGTATEWMMLNWAGRSGVRRVSWQCGYEYNPGRIKTFVLGRFVPKFDFHLCYHSNAGAYSIGHGATPGQVLVMHNTIDESKIVAGDKVQARAEMVAKWPQLAGKKIVLYVGAVLAEKRLEVVFEAMNRMADAQVCFLVVGDGPHLAVLKERFSSRTDWVSAGRVVDGVGVYFDAADVFVLPGTGGLAINEAMAHQLAVVSGYADGSADDLVVDGVTGYRLKDESADTLAQALQQVLADPVRSRAMGLAGEQRIRGDLSFQRFIDRVVGVLVDQHRQATGR